MSARATEQQIGTASRPPGDRATLLLLLLLSALMMTVLAVLRDRLDLPAGDEPHYLIMSQAMQMYHSLDVQRVYDAGDYWVFYPRPIQPHTVPGPGGRLLPLHAIGGPVLWLVPFALAGRAGVMAFMVGVSLLTVANVFLLVRTLGVGVRTAFAVGLAFAVGTPILTYSSMSFVEPIGALVCVYALRLLHTTRLRTRDLLAVSTALGVLPWVHARFLLFPPLFLLFLLLRLRRDGATRRQYITAITPLALLLLGLEVYNLLLWHTASPAPNQVTAGAVPFQNSPIPGLIGTAVDPGIGVLPNFPIFLLVLPGILLTTSRRWRSLHLQLAALVVPYTVVVCSFQAWDGAWSPPARFAAVVLPMLSVYVALALHRARSVVVLGIAVAATVYSATLITLAVFTPDGGFTTGAAARPVLPPMVAAWTAATILTAAGVWLLRLRQTRKSQAPSTP